MNAFERDVVECALRRLKEWKKLYPKGLKDERWSASETAKELIEACLRLEKARKK